MATGRQKITIYNHKGGVGKTTLTVNIAAALGEKGKRILLVDTDPQCNLTSYLLADEVVNDLLDHSGSAAGKTIWTSLKPVLDGIGPARPVKPVQTGIDNIHLLPGDIRLSEYEAFLGDAWTDCLKRRLGALRATASISSLTDQLAAEGEFDYVFFDTGPNIGPLNRVILLDTDYFIVPVACDLFSVRALGTLGQTLKSWLVDWNTISSLAPDDAELLQGKPRFLGYIPQRFKVYGQAMAKAPTFYMHQIQRQMFRDVVAVLRKVDPDLVPSSMSDTELGQVKEFGVVVQSAQRQGVPLSGVTGSAENQKVEAWDAFQRIAENILRKTEKTISRGKLIAHRRA
jgi:cellulose biosynthesis protein BcsQ